MSEKVTASALAAPQPRIVLWQVVLGLGLAGTSGAAILAHVFGPLPMQLTVPFLVMPAVFFLLGVISLAKRLDQRFRLIARLLGIGAGAGLLGTIAYDVSRPLVKLLWGFSFNPFGAMPLFGSLMTGRPVTDTAAVIAGWAYHVWNGISFGMMFAILRSSGGWLPGLVWGLCLQTLMFATYPRLLKVRLDDPGFVAMGLIGHALWGVVLGIGVRRWARNA